jgi:hypothetical protein
LAEYSSVRSTSGSPPAARARGMSFCARLRVPSASTCRINPEECRYLLCAAACWACQACTLDVTEVFAATAGCTCLHHLDPSRALQSNIDEYMCYPHLFDIGWTREGAFTHADHKVLSHERFASVHSQIVWPFTSIGDSEPMNTATASTVPFSNFSRRVQLAHVLDSDDTGKWAARLCTFASHPSTAHSPRAGGIIPRASAHDCSAPLVEQAVSAMSLLLQAAHDVQDAVLRHHPVLYARQPLGRKLAELQWCPRLHLPALRSCTEVAPDCRQGLTVDSANGPLCERIWQLLGLEDALGVAWLTLLGLHGGPDGGALAQHVPCGACDAAPGAALAAEAARSGSLQLLRLVGLDLRESSCQPVVRILSSTATLQHFELDGGTVPHSALQRLAGALQHATAITCLRLSSSTLAAQQGPVLLAFPLGSRAATTAPDAQLSRRPGEPRRGAPRQLAQRSGLCARTAGRAGRMAGVHAS